MLPLPWLHAGHVCRASILIRGNAPCIRYLENRRETMNRRGITLPMPAFDVFDQESQERLETQIAKRTKNPIF